VKDAHGCTQTIPATVSQPNPLTFSLSSATEPSCFGGSNGQITVNTATGGTPAYLYSIDFNTPQASTTFTGLSAGLHIIGVIDAHQCLDSIHVLLSEPAQLVADTISTQSISCFGGNNGAITIGVSGGTYPYSYTWPQAPAITDSLGVNLVAGTYSTYITDANGCKDTVTATLSQPSQLVPSIGSLDSISCFGANDGSVVVNATGGTQPYAFTLDGGTSQNSGIYTGLTPGAHTVAIQDAHGCDTSISFSTYEPPLLTDTVLTTINDSCFGQCDGSITVAASGGTLPYLFSIDGVNFASATTFTGLCANPSYTITVKDRNNCQNNIQDAIIQPAPVVLTPQDSVPPTCNNGPNGSFAVLASGGAGGTYMYSVDGGPYQTNDTFYNQAVGSHVVFAKDSNGCSGSYTITILNPPPTSFYTSSVINDSCYGSSTGSITILVTGTTVPYSFVWSRPTSTDSVLSGIPVGTYKVTVTDGNGCLVYSADSVNTVTQPTSVGGTETMLPVSCYGGSNGCITVVDTGGTAPYTNSWSNGNMTTNPCGLSAGSYTDTITDNNGCKFIYSNISVTQPDSIAIIVDSVILVSCAGDSNGAIILSDSGGSPGYTYLWSNGSTSSSPSGLTVGTYTVVVTDSHGCADTANVTVGVNPPLHLNAVVANVLCPPLSNGRIILSVSGGAPTYQYLWSNGSTDSAVYGLPVGSDSVVVTDSRGCTVDSSFVITNDSAFSIKAVPDTVTINQGDNVSIAIDVTNHGAGNPAYSWTPTNGLSCTDCEIVTAAPVITTQYTITGTTDSGCISVTSSLITVNPQHQIYIPNAFTPNNDGINDLWQAFGYKKAWIFCEVEVYDRWGEKIFQSTDINFGWDGKYRGTFVEPGEYVYTFKVVFVDDYSVSNKGSITVIR
jgi:gliding motility-associated-like protein